MQLFLTGLTGHIGRSVGRALLARGHGITALVRSPMTVPAEFATRVTLLRGDLKDPGSYASALRAADAVVHAAFEYADGVEVIETEAIAVGVLAAALDASAVSRVVYTSSAFLVGDGGPRARITEHWPLSTRQLRSPRIGFEQRIAMQPRGAAVRVGMVYGGARGTVHALFDDLAHGRDVSQILRRRNRWSLIHVDDLAALYVAIIERNASGIFHGTDGIPLTAGEVVRICRDTWRRSPDDGPVADASAASALIDSEVLRRDVAVLPVRSRELGWAPRYASFVEGVEVAYADWIRCFRPAAG